MKWITRKCHFEAWNEFLSKERNKWFKSPPREVTSCAYYSSHLSSGWPSTLVQRRACSTWSPSQIYKQIFSSWKCCAKILQLHSFEKFVDGFVGGLKTHKIPPKTERIQEYERRNEGKLRSHAILFCMLPSAENVDRNELVGRNKYLKISPFFWGWAWNNFIAIRVIFSFSGTRNISLLCIELSWRISRICLGIQQLEHMSIKFRRLSWGGSWKI